MCDRRSQVFSDTNGSPMLHTECIRCQEGDCNHRRRRGDNISGSFIKRLKSGSWSGSVIASFLRDDRGGQSSFNNGKGVCLLVNLQSSLFYYPNLLFFSQLRSFIKSFMGFQQPLKFNPQLREFIAVFVS